MAYVAPQPALDARLIGAIEDVEIGTEPVGISAANDTLLIDGNAKVASVDGSEININPVKSGFTKTASIVGKQKVQLSFDLFLEGSGGSGGVQPKWVRCVEACGHSIASGDDGNSSSWILSPTSTPRSMAFHWHESLVRRKILGAFGTAVFNFPAGDAPRINFTFVGLYEAETDNVTLPTDAYPVSYARQVELAALTVGSYSPRCQSMTFDLGAIQDDRDDINSAKGFYGRSHQDRNPSGQMLIEQETRINNYDPEGDYNAGTMRDVAWQQGSVAIGSLTSFSLNDAQTKQPTKGTVGAGAGRGQLTVPFMCQNATVNGEYTVTHKEAI